MKKIIYSKSSLKAFKLFIFVAIIIFCFSIVQMLFVSGIKGILQSYFSFFSFIFQIISIILFIIISFFPTKTLIFSIITFLNSALILVWEPENVIGLLLYFLCLSSIYARGYFNKKRFIKNIISTVILILLILTELRFPMEIFLKSLLEKISVSAVLAVSLLFIHSYLFDFFEISSSNKKLNLAKFENLTSRDAEWLTAILNKVPYKNLAMEENMTEGSVKNRMKIIYETLGVGDKQGFLNKYSEFEIYFEEQISNSNE